MKLTLTYVFGGARGIGRIERARKLAHLISSHAREATLQLVACEDTSKWPSKPTPPVISYQFGDVPSISCFTGMRTSVVLIDGYPDGPAGAMRSLLPKIRGLNPRRKIALVMRDILDDPDRVRKRLADQGGYELLRRYYNGVVVLGRRDVFDVQANYLFPEALPVYYLGYLPPTRPAESHPQPHNALPSVLVTAGGGDDADWMPRVLSELSLEAYSVTAVIGPNMPIAIAKDVYRVSESRRIRIFPKVDSLLPLLHTTDLAVISGGYNTLLEAVFSRTSVIVIPRESPTTEQLIRARSMARCSNVSILRRRDLNRADTLIGRVRMLGEMRQSQFDFSDRRERLFAGQSDVGGLLAWLAEITW